MITDSALDYPGVTFQWAPSETSGRYFGSHNDVKTKNHQRWKIEGQIRKINVKSRTWNDRQIIQGIQVFMENGKTEAFGMDLHDTVQIDSLEVPVGEHIKEFVVRSHSYIDAIGFKTNKGKTLGSIGGNGGYLRSSMNLMRNIMRPADNYYVDGIQGITLVTQDIPCICEIQFKYVIVPAIVCPCNAHFQANSKSQDSDSDDMDSDEQNQRNQSVDYSDDDFNDDPYSDELGLLNP